MSWDQVRWKHENEPVGDRKNSVPPDGAREPRLLDDGPEPSFQTVALDQAEADARRVVNKWLGTA